MGRDVTGVRGDSDVDPNHEVNPKLAEEVKEVKDCEVKECTSEARRDENSLEKQQMLAVETSAKIEDKKSSSPAKLTPQIPSDGTIDKRVCGSSIPVETPAFSTGSITKSPNSTKKSLATTPQMTRRHFDDEDNWSMTSSTSVRTTRSKTTVPVAPTFSISERLEKRKEYYAKLEEKRKALEAEKQEYEARTKEEEEAALKQMRKNMKFKANPVPNFYYEKPPPKKELKKIPTTRAVSPKFGRRKSCSDARRSFPLPDEKTSGRAPRHSLGGQLYKENPTPTSTPTRKDRSKQDIAVQ